MAGIVLEKGKTIYSYGQPMTALHLITNGKVDVSYPGGSYTLGKGDVISICEICSEIHLLGYTTLEDTTILTYPLTSQIFMEVLRMESEEADDVFSDSITEDATAADILLLFLKEQKKELLRKKNTLTQATYEFYFENELPKRDNILKKQFDSAVKIIEKLIEAGVDNGEFICEDCEGTARNIMFVLEGLKISAQTIGVTAEAVDREILYLLRGLGVED